MIITKNWKDKNLPLVIPISVNSKFHQGTRGDEQLREFINYIYSKVEDSNKITIIICDYAHLYHDSLNQDIDKVRVESFEAARDLVTKFTDLFENKNIRYWSQYIDTHECYLEYKTQIEKLFKTDREFANIIKINAISICKNYSGVVMDPLKIEEMLLRATILDLLERCVFLMMLSKDGFRYHLYPGKAELADKYILKKEGYLKWVKVYVNLIT